MKDSYKTRIAKARKLLLSHEHPSALVLSSATTPLRSRDTALEFRQSSDFYYLTGSHLQGALLMVSSEEKQPMLFAARTDAKRTLWEGPAEPVKPVARAIGAKLCLCSDPVAEAARALSGIRLVFAQNDPGTLAARLIEPIIRQNPSARGKDPIGVIHSDAIMEQLRLYKEPSEVALIEEAAGKTNLALFTSLPFIRPGVTEFEYAATLEYLFRMQGASVAFQTIAACGRNAATLHHPPSRARLRQGELFLIDCGAEVGLYAADITRTVPLSGSLTRTQEIIYRGVLDAQLAAIEQIRPGVLVRRVYEAAARELIRALLKLRVINGSVGSILSKGTFRPYFPHGIGHSLGLDVHDIGNLRANNEARLERDMVITVEPGLYFPRSSGNVPACGVRIEDDVLVTARGCRVLSSGFPKEPGEVRKLFKG